CGVMAVFV
ncbi:hypothetical protein A2U01_0095987, partial [Trifolium medium]|nr:hypothetical protein [Trifolium medium]